MPDIRTGFGYDAHRFGGPGPVILCGVPIDAERGVVATSDGDVAVHAVCDAILGAAALGDIGLYYPSSEAANVGASSLAMLDDIADLVVGEGFSIGNVDVTLIVEQVRIAPHRESMRVHLAEAMGIAVERVSVKATTTDGLGWIGSGEGLAAHAVATLVRT